MSRSNKKNMALYREVAKLHIEGISRGFLPQLGLGFMTLLYEAIDNSPSSVLLVEVKSGSVVGFVSGAAGMRGIYRQLFSRYVQLTLTLVPSLLHFKRVKRIIEIIRYSRNSDNYVDVDLPKFELLSIVVSPNDRGTGCAEQLYIEFLKYCKKASVEKFKIVVGDSLEPAHRFYQRMGAVKVANIELHQGEGSTVYVQQVYK